MPNQASAGDCAVTPSLHFERPRRAPPDRQRSAEALSSRSRMRAKGNVSRGKRLALLLTCLVVSSSVLLANDERSDFEEFQRLVRVSDFRAIQEASKGEHSELSAEQQREEFQKKVTESALSVMVRAAQFEKSYPQSQQLRQVHDEAKQSLSMAFGYVGFPIPSPRVAEVESCTRALLRFDGKDDGLHMVLFRIAESLPVDQERTRLQELTREAPSGATSSRVKAALQNLDRLGQPLELSFAAVNGHNLSLTALRGKVVVIDFWGPSCGPCVRDFPKLKELYSKYRAQGLEVLGISVDPDEKELNRFLEKHPLPWPVKYDGNDSKQHVAQSFGIAEIPVVWLVDRRGVLRDLKGREDQERKVEALLKER